MEFYSQPQFLPALPAERLLAAQPDWPAVAAERELLRLELVRSLLLPTAVEPAFSPNGKRKQTRQGRPASRPAFGVLQLAYFSLFTTRFIYPIYLGDTGCSASFRPVFWGFQIAFFFFFCT